MSGYYDVLSRMQAPAEKRLLIVMYHEFREPHYSPTRNGAYQPLFTARHFETHLRAITSHYRVLTIGKAVEEMRAPGGLKENTVAISIDDGCASIYKVAYPLLKKYNVPATVFLMTGWIGNDKPLWWHHVRNMLRQTAFHGVTGSGLQDALGLAETPFNGSVKPDGQLRVALADRIERHLRCLPDNDRRNKLACMQKLLFPRESYVPIAQPALTWDQIREMTNDGLEFEAHTSTHINLRHTDSQTIEREIAASKNEIEERLGNAVKGFAYPYGADLCAYARMESMLQSHGFDYACNAVPGYNSPSTNYYSLHRVSLPHTDSVAIVGRDLCLRFLRMNSILARQ